MARWLIRLDREVLDAVEYPKLFPDGGVYALSDGGDIYLSGEAFEACKNPGEVGFLADQKIDSLYAVTCLLDKNAKRPSAGVIFRETDDGSRTANFINAEPGEYRSKGYAAQLVFSGASVPAGPTDAQLLLAAAESSPYLTAALLALAGTDVTRSRLYFSLEALEQYLGQKVSKAGLCNKRQRERFTRSANSAEVAGIDARHAGGKFAPPANPMSLGAARDFVSGLLQTVLRRLR